jgi:uncharacterized glyoxalase superfamily protein PhnB
MPAPDLPAGATIIPTLRYRDAPAAIDWLCRVLGFEAHFVVPGEEDHLIAHAQLTLGSGMIMLGIAREDDDASFVQLPPGPDEALTQAAYLVVPEIDTHYAHSKARGADIVVDLAEQDYGGKLYAFRDPEGQFWNIGS